MPKFDDVLIVDEVSFNNKKLLFKKAGKNKAHVVTDFDRTLTPCFANGKKVNTTIAQLRNNDLLGEEYSKKAFELHAKYHPIEIDSKVPLEEKYAKMQEWWSEHLKVIVSYGLTIDTIDKVINIQMNYLREGFVQFFLELHAKNIPVLILSAALGDVIKKVLFKKHILTKNVHIISNFFSFNNEGKATGYASEIVHVLNKDESKIVGTKYEKLIESRKNVILLGDSIADLKMVGSIPYDEIIKIGFLNENNKDDLNEFKKSFDVIILNDGSLNFVNSLLKELFD